MTGKMRKQRFVRRLFGGTLGDACKEEGISVAVALKWLGESEVLAYASEVAGVVMEVVEVQKIAVRAMATGRLCKLLAAAECDWRVPVEVLKQAELLKSSGTVVDEGWEKVLERLEAKVETPESDTEAAS